MYIIYNIFLFFRVTRKQDSRKYTKPMPTTATAAWAHPSKHKCGLFRDYYTSARHKAHAAVCGALSARLIHGNYVYGALWPCARTAWTRSFLRPVSSYKRLPVTNAFPPIGLLNTATLGVLGGNIHHGCNRYQCQAASLYNGIFGPHLVWLPPKRHLMLIAMFCV